MSNKKKIKDKSKAKGKQPLSKKSKRQKLLFETDALYEDKEEGFGGLPERDLKKNLGCG